MFGAKMRRWCLHRSLMLRRTARLAPLLALLGVAGYLLGGCGGGNLSGVTGFSGEVPSEALPEITVTRPEVTLPTLPTLTETVPGATTEAPEVTTTQPQAPTTTSAPTTTRTSTTTVVETVTVPSASTSPTTTAETTGAETVAAEPTSSESGPPWGWIALAVGFLTAAVAVAVVAWRRQRRGGAS